MKQKWIGFDLDGTLAKTTTGEGVGEPIKNMVKLFLKAYRDGEYQVKIFTARAESEEKKQIIRQWLKQNNLPQVEITNIKDNHAVLIIDNIAVNVIKDTGVINENCSKYLAKEFYKLFSEQEENKAMTKVFVI